MNYIECPECGKKVHDGAPACPNCGTKIDVEVPADMKKTRHAPLDLPPASSKAAKGAAEDSTSE